MIEEIEQEVVDIDWFFTNGHEIGFVASGGGRLPTSIAKSQEDIDTLSTYFRSLSKSTDIIINPILESVVGEGLVDDRYLFDFVEMAKRGLYTFDKSVLNNFSDTQYHLVAKPITPLKLNELPESIVRIMLQTKIHGEYKERLDINSFTY